MNFGYLDSYIDSINRDKHIPAVGITVYIYSPPSLHHCSMSEKSWSRDFSGILPSLIFRISWHDWVMESVIVQGRDAVTDCICSFSFSFVFYRDIYHIYLSIYYNRNRLLGKRKSKKKLPLFFIHAILIL